MATDKKITELPIATSISASDVSVLVDSGTDYQYTFTLLLQFLEANLVTGANLSFGTTLPQNTIGNNGDVFVNTTAGSFAQKIAGTWTVVYTISAANGADGTMLYGGGVPGTSIGKNSDSYIDTLTGIFYQKTAGAWSQVFSMATGPQGPQGTAGTNGTNGTNGNTILFGTVTPSNTSTGVDGNFYINTSTYVLYGPKTSGVWGTGVSLMGAGVPGGGTTGQVLAKADNTSFNTIWQDNSFANLSGGPTDNTNLATALSGKQNSLGFTPENTANKGQPNGYPSLDSSGKVPSAQLPAYVDEVQEFANYAAFPATGATDIIYIAQDTNYEYRWSGSAYIQLVASPGSTDAVPEGTTNLYFTAARVLAVVLSGITFGTVSAITATDSILSAFGKLQAQLTALAGKVLPSGGTTGQVLAKNSATNYDAAWITPSGSSSYTFSTGLTDTSGTVTVNTSQNIGTLSNLTSNGLVQTTGGSCALSIIGTSATPAASTAAQWDANSNLSANSFIGGYATTVSSGATVTLTASSAQNQFITGSTSEIIQMPVTSTLVLGQSWLITNNGTSNTVTIKSSGTNTITTLLSGEAAIVTCILTSGTTASSWSFLLLGTNYQALLNSNNSWSGTQSYSASGTAINVAAGNITSNAFNAGTRGFMGYMMNGNAFDGGFGNITASTDIWGWGYGPGNFAFTKYLGYFNTTNMFENSPVSYSSTLTAINATATATAAQIGTRYITSTSAAATTITLPTAAAMATQINSAGQGFVFDFWIDNFSGASTVTIALGTGMTSIGSPTLSIAAGSQPAKFELVFTSATTCGIARIY